MTQGFDRGAWNGLAFHRCVRGFTLTASDPLQNYLVPPTFAFDRIEDLAAWLVEQYRECPDDGKLSASKQINNYIPNYGNAVMQTQPCDTDRTGGD